MTGRIAIVLAAGRGERLGGVAKALLPHDDGATYLARVLATARAAGVARAIVVVAAPFGDQVAAAARALGAEVVVNPEPARGMASSVATGFAALVAGAPAATAALLWPVDHPAVAVATVAALFGPDADVVVPRHGGRGGHPARVDAAVWPALAACAGAPGGARGVLRDPRWRRVDVVVDDPGVVRDIDTPADLAGPAKC